MLIRTVKVRVMTYGGIFCRLLVRPLWVYTAATQSLNVWSSVGSSHEPASVSFDILYYNNYVTMNLSFPQGS